MDFFNSLLENCKRANNIVLTTHKNADMDAVGAIFTLYYIITALDESIKEKTHIYLPSINTQTKKILSKFLPSYKELIDDTLHNEIDLLLLLDTPSIKTTELYERDRTIRPNRMIVIDHHMESQDGKTEAESPEEKRISRFIYPKFTSTCEILTNLIAYALENKILNDDFAKRFNIEKDMGKEELPNTTPKDRLEKMQKAITRQGIKLTNRDIITLLLLGILTDSGTFQYANNMTIKAAGYLLSLDPEIDIMYLRTLLQNERSREEIIAILKAAMRIQSIHKIGDYIYIITHISSYGASASSALIRLGADLAFVISFDKKNKKSFHISSRASDRIIFNTDLDLSRIMAAIGERFNGTGGGHRAAAGCMGETSKDKAFTELEGAIINEIKKWFSETQSDKEH